MDNQSQSSDEDTRVQQREKPCRTCRSRKVRCSKELPCSNCERAMIQCVYDDAPGSSKRHASAAGLGRRVTEIESHVTALSQRLAAIEDHADTRSSENARNRRNVDTWIAIGIMRNINRHTSAQTANLGSNTRGRLIHNGTSARYLCNSFWASMYDEFEDLDFILENDETPEGLPWAALSSTGSTRITAQLSSTSAGEYLLQSFIANVDQSVRVLHKPTLIRKINHFQRGVLSDAAEFDCQLMVVYCLSLLSLTEENCQRHIGESRKALMAQFRHQVECALPLLNILTTHNISTLQTLVLYTTYLLWVGEILRSSAMLSLVVGLARRIGVHIDGTELGLNPWQTELRRRLWHHIIHVDTWCMEFYGLESAVFDLVSSVSLPLNVDDSAWDTSDRSTVIPIAPGGFSDMTYALVQYEIAALSRIVLENSNLPTAERGTQGDFHTRLRSETWSEIQQKYLAQLDENDMRQALVTKSAIIGLSRVRIMQLRAMSRAQGLSHPGMLELESKLQHDALEYCNQVSQARSAFAQWHLDWIFVRGLSWHAVALIVVAGLKMLATNDFGGVEPALRRVTALLHEDRSVDFMRSNTVLWKPMMALEEELVRVWQEHELMSSQTT